MNSLQKEDDGTEREIMLRMPAEGRRWNAGIGKTVDFLQSEDVRFTFSKKTILTSRCLARHCAVCGHYSLLMDRDALSFIGQSDYWVMKNAIPTTNGGI